MNATRINTNDAGHVISSTAITLKRIVVNTKGGTANKCKITDGTEVNGAVIAIIDTANTYGTIDYDVYCPRGLKVQLYDGTAADITVVTN
jgi:hypothetical protein